jgi:hypothetical protein
MNVTHDEWGQVRREIQINSGRIGTITAFGSRMRMK